MAPDKASGPGASDAHGARHGDLLGGEIIADATPQHAQFQDQLAPAARRSKSSAIADANVRTLFVGKRRVLQIERDAKYPQMWRVRLPDVSLTDMVNLTRATGPALEIAERIEARK